MGLLSGKRALIVGVANDRSIAWGIASAFASQGADLAFTFQNQRLEKRVQSLAHSVGSIFVEQADVTDDTSLNSLFDSLSNYWERLDILLHAIAFSTKDELTGQFRDTSRINFANSMNISCYSLIDLSRRAAPMMTAGGSILTLTFQGSQKVMPYYNIMGVAKAALEASVRYLANDLGPDGIRVNAISPGPMRTLAGATIGGARKTFRATEANAPLRTNATLETIGGTAVYLSSDMGACTSGEVIHVDGGYHIMGMAQPENI